MKRDKFNYKWKTLYIAVIMSAYIYVMSMAREDLTEKGHFGTSILNFETVAPLADECAVLADCQMKLQYKLYVQLFIRY